MLFPREARPLPVNGNQTAGSLEEKPCFFYTEEEEALSSCFGCYLD